jgi:HAE1 family hydrophobic/amphiphilic exporter-1
VNSPICVIRLLLRSLEFSPIIDEVYKRLGFDSLDFAKWSEEAGLDRREALIRAGRVRLRPILMTTFALVAGMTPVAIGAGEGGDFRSPLGVTVIGGVITSTLLTLLVIPTVYEILADTRDWLGAKLFGVRRGQVAAEH